MRAGLFLILASSFSPACAPQRPTGGDSPPASVRERLETADTRLLIAGAESGGSITAARRISGGWSAGSVDLAIQSGELVASADATGRVTIERLGLWLGPIDIPESVLGHRAQLTDVHIVVDQPIVMTTQWTDDNDAQATTALDLGLSWALTVDGASAALGGPDLPPVPVELLLTGDGDEVRGDVRVHAAGLVWSWADLVKLEDLDLTLGAVTVAP
jgi:hypothetical protein